ncbi:MAG: cytochrome d ubiquinol oxidase subunit II [Alcanivoracaceae bacterium]|jgi:cytochrome d ubiquinol oxidase subunit II|nr:cytochrome d ubiquinol oxidase subunit II [Alcanivoracaceae bacterium]
MPELMPDLTTPAGWLPLAFMLMMGFAILAYVILDGFDLGVGLLFRGADAGEKDVMIASIGPFWDANESWLVLGIGILLVAFPTAHGVILGHLYLPIALMLVGLTLRGVAFDFRVKAKAEHRGAWNTAFFVGSSLAALSQGYMLGRVITGYQSDFAGLLFAAFIGVCVASGYALLGATWLIIKTTGALQLKAVRWARQAMLFTAIGIAAVSIATPLVSSKIFDKWFSVENLLMVWPIPVTTVVVILIALRSLQRLPVRLADQNHYGDWVPFACAGALFLLSFHGLAYSLFPYLVLDQITIWDAASAPESLMIIFVGAVVVVPIIMAYSFFAYRVFWGKARPLEYY